MARVRGRKALYEVIGKTSSKPRHDKSLQNLHPPGPDADTPPAAPPLPEKPTTWPKKPRIIQFNAGRIEASLPYPLAVAIIMAITLSLLLVFRLGQITYKPDLAASSTTTDTQLQAPTPYKVATEKTPQSAITPPAAQKPSTTAPTGNNRIVIKQYHTARDLRPVQKFFAEHGIDTIIEKRSSGYFLVTRNTYDNPGKRGTNGYAARMKIAEIGAGYKAPQGYESFAPSLFSDAYGEKVK